MADGLAPSLDGGAVAVLDDDADRAGAGVALDGAVNVENEGEEAGSQEGSQ